MRRVGDWLEQARALARILGAETRTDAAEALAGALRDVGVSAGLADNIHSYVVSGDRPGLLDVAGEAANRASVVGAPLAVAVALIMVDPRTSLDRAAALIRRAVDYGIPGGADNTDVDAWQDLARTLRPDDLNDLWKAASDRSMSSFARSPDPGPADARVRSEIETLLYVLLSASRAHAAATFRVGCRKVPVAADAITDIDDDPAGDFEPSKRSLDAARRATGHPEIAPSPYLRAAAQILAIGPDASDGEIIAACGIAAGLLVAAAGADPRTALAVERWDALKQIDVIAAREPRWRGDLWLAIPIPPSSSGSGSAGAPASRDWVDAAEAVADDKRAAAKREAQAASPVGLECLIRVMLAGRRHFACRVARATIRMHFRGVDRSLCDALVEGPRDEYVLPAASREAALKISASEAVRIDPEMRMALALLSVGRFTDVTDVRVEILRAVAAISGLALSGDRRAAKARSIWDAALARLDEIAASEPRWRLDMWRAIRTVIRPADGGADDDIEEIERQSQRPSSLQVNLRKLDPSALFIDDVDPEPPAPPAPSLVVVAKIGAADIGSGKDVARAFKRITREPIRLVVAPDSRDAVPIIRARLVGEAPHATRAIDMLLGDLRPGRPVRFRPTILLGSPGGGKSRLVRRIAEEIGIAVGRYDGAGSSDSAFGGTPRRWSTGEPSFPLLSIYNHEIANPIIMIDEVDKASTSMHNGRLGTSLLPFLETETSRRYADPYIMADVDLSAVSYIMTANEDTCLPSPLRDRCRILRIPEPGPEHVPALAASVARDIAREMGEDDRMAVLTADEAEIVGRLLGERPSVRRLRAIVERVLAARERTATRH